MMNLQSLSSVYTVFRLTEAEIPEILKLCQGNPFFYRHCPPAPSAESILRDMHALPPRKTMEDKFYLGFDCNGVLCAVLDLILRYPDDETAFIGFFMMRAELQGQGEGSRLVQEIFECLKPDFKYLRLGYVKGNEQSRRFWQKNGLRETGVVVHQPEYDILYTQRTL